MKFEKDESGRIAILPFYLYVMRTVSLTQARIDTSELDEDSDRFLQPYEMEAYIRGLIPNLAQLRDMPAEFIQMYCHIATHRFFFFCDPSRREQIGSKCRRFFRPSNFMKFEKDESGRIAILPFYLYVMRTVSLTQARIDTTTHRFFFFCDPSRRGKACIKKILLSNCLQELMELHQESEGEGSDAEQTENWFSLASTQRICDTFLDLDKDANGTISKEELRDYADGTLTDIFIERAFDEHVRHGKTIIGLAWEMDFESFLDFTLALENRDTPEGLTYLFWCLDLNGRGYLTASDIHILFRDVCEKWVQIGNYELCTEDVRDEIWDMVKPADPLRITLADMLSCKQGGTVASMLIDVRGFWAHDNRENLLQEDEEPYDLGGGQQQLEDDS
nr:probable serine/threonine-protein phosphatase 2A regulatory subunit B'' subunit TON2 [Tanacetum cinerariifolium]